MWPNLQILKYSLFENYSHNFILGHDHCTQEHKDEDSDGAGGAVIQGRTLN